ncbi:uncharacterized protein [Venturia canescens]|uniref:uncharacterized protein n=1 Tax=Venturia canescens TaxID=32260 RepID=UPI001C9CE2B5|nr:uncharacterized protein LOC122407797 [Venturia canescens]
MSLTINNRKIVYLHVIGSKTLKNADIIRIAARLEGREFSVWIEPSARLRLSETHIKAGLYKYKGSKFILNGKLLEPKPLQYALVEFASFIASPQPVYIVSHSNHNETTLLLKAFKISGMITKFNHLINGFVDTVPIFKKQYPNLKGKGQFSLRVLAPYVLGKKYTGTFFESLYYLRTLEELVTTHVSEATLTEFSLFFEDRVTSLKTISISSQSSRKLILLKSVVSWKTLEKLKNAEISFPILEELSQRPEPSELHKYLNKMAAEKLKSFITPDVSSKIFHFFKKRKQRSNRVRSSAIQPKELVDKVDSSVEEPKAHSSSKDPYTEQRQELARDLPQLVEEQVTIYKDYPMTTQQGEILDNIYSYTAERGALPSNDYFLLLNQLENFDSEIDTGQRQEFVDELPSSMEKREGVYSCTAEQYCKFLYIHLIRSGRGIDSDIIHIAAKLKDRNFTVWIEPSKPLNPNGDLRSNGLRYRNSKLILNGKPLETKQLKPALVEFASFVTSKPVYLVSHSNRTEITHLLRAFDKTGMSHKFNFIHGFVDTVPIFKKKYPNLKGNNQFSLRVLAPYMLGKKYTGKFFESLYYLRTLEELVTTHISEATLIKLSVPYNSSVANQETASTSSESSCDLTLLKSVVSAETLKELKDAEISFPILEELSQRPEPSELHKYLNKMAAEKLNSFITPDVSSKIFHFFKERKQRSNRVSSSAIQPEELVDKVDSSVEEPKAHSSTKDPYTEQRQELARDLPQLVEEQVTIYKDYPMTTQQGKILDNIHSYTAELPTTALPNNDYFLLLNQLETFDSEIGGTMEEPKAWNSNEDRYAGQHHELASDLPPLVEEQETTYMDYAITGQEGGNLDDIHSYTAERGALSNDDDFSLSNQLETFDSEIGGTMKELKAQNSIEDSYTGERHELGDKFSSLIEEPTAYKDYLVARQQDEFLNDVHLNTAEEDKAQSKSDNLFIKQMEEIDAEIGSSEEEQIIIEPLPNDQHSSDQFPVDQNQLDRERIRLWTEIFDPFN